MQFGTKQPLSVGCRRHQDNRYVTIPPSSIFCTVPTPPAMMVGREKLADWMLSYQIHCGIWLSPELFSTRYIEGHPLLLRISDSVLAGVFTVSFPRHWKLLGRNS